MFSTAWVILEGEIEVASFRRRLWSEGATLTVGGQEFTVDRPRWTGPFRLCAGEATVVEARKPSVWKTRFEISVEQGRLCLEPEGWSARVFRAVDGDGVVLGRVGRRSWWRRAAFIDLPAAMPLPIQLFLFCLVVFVWGRQSNNATLAGGG